MATNSEFIFFKKTVVIGHLLGCVWCQAIRAHGGSYLPRPWEGVSVPFCKEKKLWFNEMVGERFQPPNTRQSWGLNLSDSRPAAFVSLDTSLASILAEHAGKARRRTSPGLQAEGPSPRRRNPRPAHRAAFWERVGALQGRGVAFVGFYCRFCCLLGKSV